MLPFFLAKNCYSRKKCTFIVLCAAKSANDNSRNQRRNFGQNPNRSCSRGARYHSPLRRTPDGMGIKKQTPADLRCHEVPLPPWRQYPRITNNPHLRRGETDQHPWNHFRTTIQRSTISRRQVGGCLFNEDGQERVNI